MLFDRKNKTKETVQDGMPLADLRGNFAILKDGSRVAFIRIEGANHSVFDFARKAGEAARTASVIAAVPVEFAILKYPSPMPISSQLALIDDAAQRERKAMSSAGPAEAERRLRKLELLALMRSGSEDEGAGVEWKTWLAIAWPPSSSDDSAKHDLENVLSAASEAFGSAARAADESEMRSMSSLYLTPSAAGAIEAPIWSRMPLPDWGA